MALAYWTFMLLSPLQEQSRTGVARSSCHSRDACHADDDSRTTTLRLTAGACHRWQAESEFFGLWRTLPVHRCLTPCGSTSAKSWASESRGNARYRLDACPWQHKVLLVCAVHP